MILIKMSKNGEQCKHRFDGQLLARHLSSDDYATFVRMQRGALEVELQRQYDERLVRDRTKEKGILILVVFVST